PALLRAAVAIEALHLEPPAVKAVRERDRLRRRVAAVVSREVDRQPAREEDDASDEQRDAEQEETRAAHATGLPRSADRPERSRGPACDGSRRPRARRGARPTS